MAAVLSASILSVATLYFENGDTEKTLPPNSMRVAAPVLAPPKLAAKAVKPSQGRQTLAAKAVPSKQGKEEPSEQKPSGSIQEMPQRDLSKSKNRFYFESLEKKILRGDAYGAISQFRTRLDGPLDADDKIVAAEMTGRYYLMVGSPQRAIESLEAICSAAPENHPMTCIHYFRALISAGKWALARSFFQKISEQPSYSPYKEQIEFSRMALLALSNHQPASVRDLFASYVSWRGSDLEWYRQRTHWLVSSLLELTRKERHDLLKSFLDLRRDSLLAFFKHSDVIGMTSADPIFIPFLNAQSALLETRSLGISGKRDLSGSVASTVATVFDFV
jgi:hypothetical protein